MRIVAPSLSASAIAVVLFVCVVPENDGCDFDALVIWSFVSSLLPGSLIQHVQNGAVYLSARFRIVEIMVVLQLI